MIVTDQFSGKIVQLLAPKDEPVYPCPKELVDVATTA